ncbi:hypothetical protein [Cellulomonas bogoriensis]|uniref:hypothetical protein n=1 Tax=Cellulomonas bogoriensis TaxID=301388 RepID=UPI000B2324BD|nr:hypothetical protein [Cellulomonas bogoriensis]
MLDAYATRLGEEVCGPAFRGCPFLNAVAEYPDPEHPARVVTEEHRAWLRATATDLLRRLGAQDPEGVAVQLVMLRDGAMAAGPGVTPQTVGAALRGAGAAVLAGAVPA